MILRPAVFDDWPILLEWRNDEETRNNSHNTDKVDADSHKKWLHAVLNNSNRKLFIALDKIPVGTIRADFDNVVYELLWTIAPEQRGKGYGKQMVQEIIEQLDAPVRAEIKSFNIASKKIAEDCGMTLEKEEN